MAITEPTKSPDAGQAVAVISAFSPIAARGGAGLPQIRPGVDDTGRMHLDQHLLDAAVALLESRGRDVSVAAAAYLDDGEILTSVSVDNINAAATLCAETGVICRAYTLGKRITASACVAKLDGRVVVLAPCGICQERLALWGPELQVAVADSGGWATKTLAELNPVYWATQFTGGAWPSMAEHR
jgi:cytidine deaminase